MERLKVHSNNNNNNASRYRRLTVYSKLELLKYFTEFWGDWHAAMND